MLRSMRALWDSLAAGMGSEMFLSPQDTRLSRRLRRCRLQAPDLEALRSDWRAIGGDFEVAIGKVQAEVNAPSKIEHSVSWQGPLPPPQTLQKFDAIVPGSAERIIRMAEQEQAHRHRMEESVVRAHRRGQWMGFCVALVALSGAIVAIVRGAHWSVPVALAGPPIAVIVASLIGKRSN